MDSVVAWLHRLWHWRRRRAIFRRLAARDTQISTESLWGYRARERWAGWYDSLHGAPEGDSDSQ